MKILQKAQSGSRGIFSPSPHTTLRAGSHSGTKGHP